MTESKTTHVRPAWLRRAVRVSVSCLMLVACGFSASQEPAGEEHEDAVDELSDPLTKLSGACTAKILEITPAPRQPVLGEIVAVRGAGICMAGITPEYRFLVRVNGTDRVLCDWQTQPTCSWDSSVLPGPDYYRIVLETRRSGQVVADGSAARSYAVGPVCTDVSLIATRGAGGLVELHAAASCDAGIAPLYRFEARAPGGRWVTLAPFAASADASWDASSARAGRAQLRVSVSRADHMTVDATRTIAHNVGVACTASALVVPRGAGVRMVTANAACGDGATPEYRFGVEAPDGGVATLRDWAASPLAAWDTTDLNGKYRVSVEVRAIENQSQSPSQLARVVTAGTQCSVNLEMPGGVLPPALPLVFSATTNCPSPELAFSVRPATDTRFVPACKFASAGSCNWQPPPGALPGQYYVRVQVRRAGGALIQATAMSDFSLGGSARCIASDQCPVEQVCVGGVATRVCIEPTLRCAEGQPCPVGTYCEAGSCGPAPAIGEPCAPGRRCAVGAYCAADGACQPSLERLAACSPDYPPEQCVPSTACRADDHATMRCLAPGDTSGCTSDSECKTDAFCGVGGSCRSYLSLGQHPCYSKTSPGTLRCGTGLYCKNDGTAGGVCAALPGSGAKCQTVVGRLGDSAACAPGNVCVAKVCRPLSNVGEDCSKVACAAGLACVNGESNGACFLGGTACGSGYVPDGAGCVDLDECATGSDDCGVHATCTNTQGGFSCACKPGYSGDGKTCADVDECQAGTENCGEHAICVNTEGGFGCSCEPGYSPSGDGVSCTDVDECRDHQANCGPLAYCTNIGGGYTCTCLPGYRGDGVTCTDVDECAEQLDDCGVHAACFNTIGGFGCQCDEGYSHVWLGDHYECTCTSPTVECAGQCVDVSSDPANCGECGASCEDRQACAGGRCTSARFVSVSAGLDFSCAVRQSGEIVCWGTHQHASPPNGSFISVSAGAHHACALTPAGGVACWGENGSGQLLNTTDPFLAVSAGYLTTCGIRGNGNLFCWGDNSWGQAAPPSGTFTAVSIGTSVGCGVRTDGSLACWGYSGDGRTSPPSGAFRTVSVGGPTSCGVRVDGALACWGSNASGLATPPAGSFASVSVAFGHACAIRDDQTVACWGEDRDGAAQPPAGTFSEVSAGSRQTSADTEHSCGLRTDGLIVCWGDNAHGECNVPQ